MMKKLLFRQMLLVGVKVMKKHSVSAVWDRNIIIILSLGIYSKACEQGVIMH